MLAQFGWQCCLCRYWGRITISILSLWRRFYPWRVAQKISITHFCFVMSLRISEWSEYLQNLCHLAWVLCRDYAIWYGFFLRACACWYGFGLAKLMPFGMGWVNYHSKIWRYLCLSKVLRSKRSSETAAGGGSFAIWQHPPLLSPLQRQEAGTVLC